MCRRKEAEGVVVVAANHAELAPCLAAVDKNARGTETAKKKKANYSPLDFCMTHTDLWAVVRTDSILAKALFTSEHFW